MSNFIDIGGDVALTFFHESKVIGITSTQVKDSPNKLTRGFQLRAAPDNTGIIYIGKSNVTADTNPETDGFPLAAGEGLFLPIERMNIVYAIATVANQQLFWIAI